MIFVYITNPNKKTAEKIAYDLLKKKLIGCANIFPIESLYWWRGKIERTKEYVVIAKTLGRNYERVKREVRKIHPYTVPCIAKLKAWPNNEYLQWLREEIQ